MWVPFWPSDRCIPPYPEQVTWIKWYHGLSKEFSSTSSIIVHRWLHDNLKQSGATVFIKSDFIKSLRRTSHDAYFFTRLRQSQRRFMVLAGCVCIFICSFIVPLVLLIRTEQMRSLEVSWSSVGYRLNDVSLNLMWRSLEVIKFCVKI